MGFILSYIAILLFSVVYLLDGIVLLFVNVKNRKWFKVSNQRTYSKAFKTDVLANWLFPMFWTVLFSWKGGYKFGRFGESLSSCIGRKYIGKTLNWIGLFFYYFLYAIDYTNWKQGGHCIAEIMTEEQIEDFKNK